MASDPFDLTNRFQRQHSFKFELLNKALNRIGVLEVDAASTPSISHDVGRTINRTINSIVISETDRNNINPFTDRVRPVMVADGRDYSLGTYLFSSSSLLSRPGLKSVRTVAMVDQTFLADQPTDSGITFASGTPVTSAIKIVLDHIGGFEYRVTENLSVVGAPKSWSVGTSALQIVNDLCKLIGYLPLHFNHSGVGVIRPAPDPSAATANITYKDPQIYADTLVTNETLEAPNRYVIVDTAAAKPLVGTYNVPARLPYSYENRGILLRETMEVQGLGSISQANLAVAAFAYWDARQGSASFSGPPNPTHDSYDILMVGGRKYLETGWSLPLIEGGDMSHNLIPVGV